MALSSNAKHTHQWRSVVVGVTAVVAIVVVALFASPEARNEAYAAISAIISIVVMRHALSSTKEKDDSQ